MTSVFCGIDWATDHHDIALLNEAGTLLDKLRIDDTPEGLSQLLQLLAQHGDSPENPIPVAIETSHGLLVACLRATGRPIYVINPLTAARYRDRYALSRKKSDHLDAKVLANILREYVVAGAVGSTALRSHFGASLEDHGLNVVLYRAGPQTARRAGSLRGHDRSRQSSATPKPLRRPSP